MPSQNIIPNEGDEQLVALVLAGDKSAFDVLIIKYQHRITKLIARIIPEPAEINDVSQEIFIKAFRSLEKFRGDSTFYTWLYRIAINTAKNYSIDQGRRPPGIDIDIMLAEEILLTSKLKEFASPDHLLMRDEIEATLYQTLEKLPEDLRFALILREIEGLSYEDIAEILECPIGTVRSRIFRAREAIDHDLDDLINDQ